MSNTPTSTSSTDIGRRKRLGESNIDEEGSELLAPTIEEFQRWCSKLKTVEDLSIFQTFCNDYLDKLIQEKEGEAKQLDTEFEQIEDEKVSEEGASNDSESTSSEEDENGKPKQTTQEIIKSNLKVLQKIKQSLRDRIPNNDGYAPNERFYFPGEVAEETNPNRQFEGYSKYNTINVDGFLYDNEEMNEMFRGGLIPEFYCEKCCSSNHVKPMNIISHSFSLDELSFIFSHHKLLSKKNMRENGIVMMDIGSRLGSILYYCYLFVEPLSVKQLIGVEINEFFANLQKEMVKQYKMDDRISIVNSDIMKEMDLIQTCDLLIMHNVFEWFFSHKENQAIWKILKSQFLIRKGLRIVTCPSIQQSLLDAGLSDILSIDGWLKEIPLAYPLDDNDEEMHTEIHLYEVL
ncbi:predicted protein [Naegleria gruberi]|uniref:Predicted protein n=1 Tax=Naegleria gruberi TaxID=5762 RepID=D2VDW3_NAEGR|nr:uncharacterized protein NAEGRDRAFT_33265 [Naegleria gruberi]EFC44971.1 predicted protein [Naegleria gruberi]|eukprot:XP_002677715.1 predicted protein [Naegleria gruberi strain NEG-M]